MDGGEGVALPGAERGKNLMKPERWEKVIDLFQTAVERAPEERAAFLDESCHGDEEMRREVESLLTSHERAENFIEVPAFKATPEFVPNDSADALVGNLIGHYRIESLIGVGGMGKVYLARDERLGRKAAVKPWLPRCPASNRWLPAQPFCLAPGTSTRPRSRCSARHALLT